MTERRQLLEVQGLTKTYPGVLALDQVSLELYRGEVHAIVGENGAGKSTLARLVAGIGQADAGSLRLYGSPFAPTSRHDAERRGVRMVMQELNVIPTLTVAENIFIEQMPNRLGCIDYRKMNGEAARIMSEVGLKHVSPEQVVGSLGVGQQQLVEIAAGLSRNCDVLILDEPTAALTDAETDLLFSHIARAKQTGVGVIYISHRMEELRRTADRITVLRDGRLVATRGIDEVTTEELVRLMVGRQVDDRVARRRSRGELAMRVVGLRCDRVKEVSFEAYRGEILGFAGLMGSGRSETMRAVFGADRADAGAVYLFGSTRPATIRSPRDAVRNGIALLTEDRKQEGLLLPLSIMDNATLTHLNRVATNGAWVRTGDQLRETDRLVNRLGIRCRAANQRAIELSGGNQQKLVLAKWIFRDCDILIFDEPTRGIDVGARFEIYRLLNDLADAGKAIVVVSSDLPELLALCERIAVMSAGKLKAVLKSDECNQQQIMALALSEYQHTPSRD